MRAMIIVLLAVALLLAGARVARGATTVDVPASHAPLRQVASSTAATDAVPAHEGSRVGVQLVVMGIAAGVVLVVGSAAYVIRKRLGLAAPPPGDQPAGGVH